MTTNIEAGKRQTALVTGASAGIGVDLAECFARDGYDVIITARSEDALREVASRLSSAHGTRVTPIAQDLGRIGGGAKLAEAIRAQGHRVDVLVNNAGYGSAGAFSETDIDTELGMIDLNDRALVELTHIYWPSMLASRSGATENEVRPSIDRPSSERKFQVLLPCPRAAGS